MSSCQPNKDNGITEKNKCYEIKLKMLRSNVLYNQVHSQFKDTFELLKMDKKHFGIADYVENKIDDAIFFNKDNSECMLIVLEKMADTLIFGSARMIRGKAGYDGKWTFTLSMAYNFVNDYFDLYKENNFENIAKLARYSVLTEGKAKKGGCEIDEHYWFELMKQ
jgi:hypothetical protein